MTLFLKDCEFFFCCRSLTFFLQIYDSSLFSYSLIQTTLDSLHTVSSKNEQTQRSETENPPHQSETEHDTDQTEPRCDVAQFACFACPALYPKHLTLSRKVKLQQQVSINRGQSLSIFLTQSNGLKYKRPKYFIFQLKNLVLGLLHKIIKKYIVVSNVLISHRYFKNIYRTVL